MHKMKNKHEIEILEKSILIYAQTFILKVIDA